MASAIRQVTGEATVQPGKVRLEVPPLKLSTPEEKQAAEGAQRRRDERLSRKGQEHEWMKLLL